MDQKVALKALKYMCKEYNSNVGKSLSKIDSYSFDYFFFSEGLGHQIVKKEYDKNPASTLMSDIVSELVSLGYVQDWQTEFCLTEKGYKFGTRSVYMKFLQFLNNNPGISILLSFLAFIVSLISLYVSFNKS